MGCNFAGVRIKKEVFSGDWPFYSDEVTVERQEPNCCVVFIDGQKYALNGMAQDQFKIKGVHEAGVAVIGKSIGPFIDIALNLGKK